jgi:hypothetical protein
MAATTFLKRGLEIAPPVADAVMADGRSGEGAADSLLSAIDNLLPHAWLLLQRLLQI